jgi:Protein of unknown function (DUF3489)
MAPQRWRSPIALIVTKFGRDAIKGANDRQRNDAAADASAPSSIASVAPSRTAVASKPDGTVPRQGSKLAEVMALLGRKQGVRIEELTSATGWLPHTTRAALTGLRKRGFAIERSRVEKGGSVYRIVAGGRTTFQGQTRKLTQFLRNIGMGYSWPKANPTRGRPPNLL